MEGLEGIIRQFIAFGIAAIAAILLFLPFLPRSKEEMGVEDIHKRKIIEFLSVRRSASPAEAGTFLGVSPEEGLAHLRELEKRGVLRRVKNTGINVLYELTQKQK